MNPDQAKESRSAATIAGQSPLLERVRSAARARGDARETADVTVAWARRYILFHNKRHPAEMGLPEATHFLEHVVKMEAEPLPALAQARSALSLLYCAVLGIDLGELPQPRPPRLLDQLRLVLRVRHYSPRTEDCYYQWARRFILHHNKRHPRAMGSAEVEQFLTHLAVAGHVSSSTQNQALNAILFLYSQVLEIDLGRLDAVRARRGQRLPVVLAPEEVRVVLDHVEGADGLFRLMAKLLYGCGLRLAECCGLRVHDLDLARGQVLVRAGKGNKDRVVMLPKSARADLQRQLEARRSLHDRDLSRGVARVDLPDAIERKYPRAAQAFEWQFVFASRQLSHCPRTGRIGRHHVLEGSLQRAVAQAGAAAKLDRAIHCHTFRHSFATHLVERGVNIRSVQLLLGHESLETTMIYTHVARKGVIGVASPLDLLNDISDEDLRAAVFAAEQAPLH
jgi:integron integrase